MENEEIVRRFSKLESERKTVEQIWQVIEEYITPYRGKFFRDESDEHSIEWSRRKVFDSTAIVAHQTLSASLHGALTSPAIRWFDMRFRTEKLNKNKRALQWIQGVAERVHYELQDSNFNLEINEAYQDLVGPGTAFMTLEEDRPDIKEWTGLNFSSVPLKEGYFEQDDKGKTLRFYRSLEWTAGQIIARFGPAGLPDDIIEQEKAGSTNKNKVIFAIFPRQNRIENIRNLNRKEAPSKRPWEYRYVLKNGAITLGKPGGYYEMPAFAARWRKTSSSIWGNSPSMLAIYDVLTLNEARHMQLLMAEKLIDPPILAEERAIVSDLSMKAGTLNIIRSRAGIEVFDSKGSLPVSDHMIEQLQQAVKDYFFIDQLRMPHQQAQPMTATEIQMRHEQMQRQLGPTLGRIANDLLDPIISRTVRMLARAGELEDPPPVVIEEDAEWDIIYLGSLQRAQKTDEAASVERLVMMVGNLAQVMPDMLLTLDQAEIVRHIGRSLNVPAGIMLDADEVKAKQEEQQAKQEAAMQAQQAQMEGEAMEAQAKGQQAMMGGPNAQ